MSVPSEEPSPEGKRFREELEKSARFGTTVAGLGDSGDRHLDKSWEGNTDQKRLLHQSEKKQYPLVTMETASTGQSYSFQQEVSHLPGGVKREEQKTSPLGDRIAGLESQGMFSIDSGIEMTPSDPIDVARDLLESGKTEAYNYMDISCRKDPLVGQPLALDDWERVSAAASDILLDKDPYGRDLTKTPVAPATTGPTPTMEALAAGITQQRRPLVSERESILSVGVMGVPTVTLSEPDEDSHGSSTPPTEEADSPLDFELQASEESPLPSSTATQPDSQDREDSSIESGDSEIELVLEEPPPPRQGPASTPHPSPAPAGAPSPAPPPPPIQYSILREEREAELDSELILEPCDESPIKQRVAPRPPTEKAQPRRAASPPSPISAHKPAPPDSCAAPTPNVGHVTAIRRDVVEATPPAATVTTTVRVEQPPVEEKAVKQRRTSQTRTGSDRRASVPAFLQSLDRQTAVKLLYWRDVKQTGLLLSAMLLLLLSLTQFSVVSVMAYLALAALSTTISFRVYKSVLQAVQKTDEGHPFKAYLEMEVALSPEQMQRYAETAQHYLNSSLKELRRLFLVQDLVDSLKFAVLMWLLTYVGALFNGLTLLIMAVVSMFSMPVVYEKYQAQIDQYLGLIRTHVNCVVGKIKEKIPGAKRKAE
nr:reticulon-1-like isoform X1 [Paramormyrops kingsleyae]